MKRRIVFLLFLGFLASLDAPHIGARANCTTTVSPDEATVQATVNAAADGAVICLTAGTVNYDTGVAFGTKGVEIRGAGTFGSPWGSAGQTVIHLRNSAIAFSGFESTGHSTTISNIKFTYGVGSALTNYGIITWNRQGGVGGLKHWLIHHNDFEISGREDSPKSLVTGALGGVIFRNKFMNQPFPPNYVTTNLNVVMQGITDDGSLWDSPSTMGSADTSGANNLYVETNYFNGFAVALDQNTSSRVVWRFNEMHNSSTADHGYDSSAFGERHGEFYNNNFICDTIIRQSGWISKRGGTGMIFNNTFAPFDRNLCGYPDGRGPAIRLSQFKFLQCESNGGWPGLYPDSYPLAHQLGWGWINASNISVGGATKQAMPGGAGFRQALEPMYIFNNLDNGTDALVYRASGYVSDCRAMAYSSNGKTSGTTLTATGYVSAGQHALVAFGDLVGGAAPTISDNFGNTWSQLQGGTNGGMRLSAWHSRMNASGRVTVTISFGSSAAARAGVLVTLRQLETSPLDRNPAVVIDNASPYDGPSSGTLIQSNEVVLGYSVLNGPTTHTANQFLNDAIVATYPDLRAVFWGYGPGNVGINGTSGGVADSNVSIAVTYRYVNSTTAVQPQIMNQTANRNGILGTVSFRNNGIDPELQVTDFVQPDREYYQQTTNFNGTSGVGSGPRSARPASCTTGVAYWSIDQGSWNRSVAGGQGVLDKCASTNSWQNAWYVPYVYPHPHTDMNPPNVSISISSGGR
jgi:hypothetical protein